MTRRIGRKRLRNKFSPQSTFSPKKYRNFSALSAESVGEDLSKSEDSTTETTKTGNIASGEMDHSIISESQSEIEASQVAAPVTTSLVGPMHMSTPPPPASQFYSQSTMIDNGVLVNFPQQMLQLSGQMPQMPPPPPPKLSDEEIVRIAQQMKNIIREDIDKLVEERVASAVEPLKKEISELKSTICSLQSDIKSVISKNDELEQYSRRACLRISGIKESENENVTDLVFDLADRIGADIRPADIDRAHRVGRMRDTNDANHGREIIVKFNNSEARLQVLKGRSKLREQRAKIFINEDRTKVRKTLAYECRQLKKKRLIVNTWVYAGNVYIQTLNGAKRQISCLSDIDPTRGNVPPPRV